jgi:hypothetical protein
MKKGLFEIGKRIKYKAFRAYLKMPFSKRFDESKLNDEQRAGIKIVKTLAVQPSSEILLAPISNKYYIENDEVFVIVSEGKVSIINSVYHYDIYNTDGVSSHLIQFINQVIEKRSLSVERRVRAKIEKSLGTVLEDLNVKFKQNKKGEV